MSLVIPVSYEIHGLREQLRAARRQKALSQAALAARSGTSRVTIARLEAGSARISEWDDLPSLRGARARAQRGTAGRGLRWRRCSRANGNGRAVWTAAARHAVLAARLLAARRPEAAALVRQRARRRRPLGARAPVQPSLRFALARDARRPVERVAQSLLEPGEWSDALFQNSPWTFALEPTAA